MIENNQAIVLWNRCLNFIKDTSNYNGVIYLKAYRTFEIRE